MGYHNNGTELRHQTCQTRCAEGHRHCQIDTMAEILGVNIQDILMNFISGAEAGARLTLHKTRTGFTVQVVGCTRESPELNTADLCGSAAFGPDDREHGETGPPTAPVETHRFIYPNPRQ